MTSSLGADRSPRTRAGLSVVLAATLTALTALGPNAHAAEPADSPPDVQSLFGVTDSRHVEGAALAAGTLRDGRGSPSANAPVVLFAWPTEAVLTAAQDGDVLPLTPVAATATDRSGAFQLRVANTNVLERFLAGDGSADLAILIPNGSTHTVHPFSVSSDELRIAGAAARREAAQGRRDTSAGVEHGLGLHLGKPQTGEPAGEAVVDWDDYREMMVCYSTQKQNYGPVWTAVGETYNASGVRSDFRYQTNGSTSLGVAISASGYWATWKQENGSSQSRV